MKIRLTKIKKLVDKAMNMLKHARIPKFSSKFSPRIYTQHQHFLILILKKYFRASYRDIVEILEEMTRIREDVKLKRIPHYTTLQKFFDRIKDSLLYSLLIKASKAFAIAVDSTGFPAYSSSYYDRIAKKSKKKRYQKMSIAIDTRKQTILNVLPGVGYTHDSKYFIPLTENLNAKYFIADKGYDSTKNIMHCLKKNAVPLIDIKDNVKTGMRAKLKEKNKKYAKIYHKRSLVENAIFVIKKKFGDTVYSRKYDLLKKEIVLKAVTYNAYKEIYCLITMFSTELNL